MTFICRRRAQLGELCRIAARLLVKGDAVARNKNARTGDTRQARVGPSPFGFL